VKGEVDAQAQQFERVAGDLACGTVRGAGRDGVRGITDRHIAGLCDAGVSGKIRFVADLPIDNLIVWTTNFGPPAAVDIQTSNALGAGTFYEQPHTGGVPQSVTIQAAYNDGGREQIATAWVTTQTAGGQCVFTGQAITTL
jgi:hypothetical protein